MLDGGIGEACAAPVEGEVERGRARTGPRNVADPGQAPYYMMVGEAMKKWGKKIKQKLEDPGDKPDPYMGTFSRAQEMNARILSARRKLATLITHYEHREEDSVDQEEELKEAQYQYETLLKEHRASVKRKMRESFMN